MGCGSTTSFAEELMVVNRGVIPKRGSESAPFIIITQDQPQIEQIQQTVKNQVNEEDKVQLYLHHQPTQQVVWTDFQYQYDNSEGPDLQDIEDQAINVGLQRINTIQE